MASSPRCYSHCQGLANRNHSFPLLSEKCSSVQQKKELFHSYCFTPVVLYDRSFPHKYFFHICGSLSQLVPNKPKICSVVIKATLLVWVTSVAWTAAVHQLYFCRLWCSHVKPLASYSKVYAKGTWSLEYIKLSMNIIDVSCVISLFWVKKSIQQNPLTIWLPLITTFTLLSVASMDSPT